MALGNAGNAQQPATPAAAAKQTDGAKSASTTASSIRADQQAIREKIDRDLRNGKYTEIAKLLPQVQPQLKDLSEVELLRIVAKRARQLLEEDKANGFDAQQPGSNNGSGNGGVLTFDGPTSVGERDRGILGLGEWNNPPGLPGIGTGSRSLEETYRLKREASYRQAFLRFRSMFGTTVDFSNLAFADEDQAGGGGVWEPLELPSNTRDFDGDGEVFDPLPARPVVVYYQFLEESMTNIDWVDGEDLINQVGLRTNDDNEDDAVDFLDNADVTDGIADTWPAIAGLNRSVIPPPDPADEDEELTPFLLASGLGAVRWGDARPVFLHPDAEAAWRLAQSLYGPALADFEATWDNSQVLEEEERQVVLTAMRVIESVTNIVFLERPDGGPGGKPFTPPYQAGTVRTSYPLNPVGYTLEINPPTVAVDPGGIPEGDPAIPEVAEVPSFPDDDYPWMLILKGSNPVLGDMGPAAFSAGGTSRNDPGPPEIDYALTDIDGDGFPDTPDINFDGAPDLIVLSSQNFGNIVPEDPGGRSVLDTDGSTVVDEMDSTIDGSGNVPFFAGLPPKWPFDMNLDFTPDSILDTAPGGTVNFGIPSLGLYGDLAIDFEPDGVADSVFPTGTVASPFTVTGDPVPCSLVGLSQENLDGPDIGFIVYGLMGEIGLLPEHNRPDREEFIRVLEENLLSGGTDSSGYGIDIIPGGSDKYANFIDNFDTTTETIPAAGLSPHLPGNWTVDNSGAGFGSGWAFLDPSTVPADVAAGVTPPEDYAVDDEDMSAIALVTGPNANTGIRGTAVAITPNIFGPQDATVRFAYWVNTANGEPIQEGDGLIVQSSLDGGTTWTDLIEIRDQAAEWRLAEVEIGEERADDQTGLPTFQVRFIAQNLDASRLNVEIAIDRVRVQNPYDFLSIMHGGEFWLARTNDPGFETFQVREGFEEFQDRIGNAEGLSLGDRIGLANLYGIPVFPDGDGAAPDPCRADMNGDGIISAVDVALFLQLFNAGDMQADFAEEFGVLDIFDLLAFFTDVQNSFRCINDPDNNFGENNLGNIDPG